MPRFMDVDRQRVDDILTGALAEGQTYLPEVEATQVLEAYGLPVLPARVAATAEQAAQAAGAGRLPGRDEDLQPDVVHKFDVGGVVLNVPDGPAAARAFEQIMTTVRRAVPGAHIKGVIVQRMAPAGREVILGIKRDPAFGPVVMFGLGGTFVEVFRDVAFRVVPFDVQTVRSMVREVKSYPILAGVRGGPAYDVAVIEQCIERLGQLVLDFPQIAELDVNPVIVLEAGRGAVAADARIGLAPAGAATRAAQDSGPS